MEQLDVSPIEEVKESDDDILKTMSRPIIETLLGHYVAVKLTEGVPPEEIIRLLESNEADLSEVDLQYSLTIVSSFTDPIKDAILKGNFEVASVLAGTQIEHIMNMFLNDILGYKFSFSDNEVSQILNAISLPAKLSWFLIVATGFELSDSLCEKLTRIVSLRNKIAHFKSLDFNKKLFPAEDIALLSNSPILLSELEQELSGIWFKAFPQYEEANKILKENFDINSSYLSRRLDTSGLSQLKKIDSI